MSTGRRRAVQLVHWPTERHKLEWCREHTIPRVLIVGPGAEPPEVVDQFEDWVRPPLSQLDLNARIAVLERRLSDYERPEILGYRELVFRGAQVTVSHTQARLSRLFIDHYRNLVPRSMLSEELCRSTDRADRRRNVLDLHITRLRRKFEAVGLQLTTVWGSGYQLEPSDDVSEALARPRVVS